MKILITTSPSAPGCFLICRSSSQGRPSLDEEDTILVQLDWDYPGLASNFGWVPCPCGDTDGTVDCAHRTASEMIAEAESVIHNHLEEEFDDPGYFGGGG